MKILITGFNKEQCTRDYFLKKELKILNSHYSLIRCLEDMGHEIEQRPVSIGEDLSAYDKVIIYLASVKSFSHHAFDALYALTARPDAILANDDWQVAEVAYSFGVYKKNLEEHRNEPFLNYHTNKYLADLYTGDTPLEDLGKHIDTFIAGCEEVTRKDRPLMLCTFAGGDNTKFRLNWQGKIIRYNPNPYNLNRRPENSYGEDGFGLTSFFDEGESVVAADQKERAWVFSSIVQSKTMGWLKKQNPKLWPVKNFGPRRESKEVEKTFRVKEPEMCKIYNQNWGCLMPEYYHAGSGWWRSRVQQVADVESILLCSDAEGKIYGDAYVGNTIEKIENMSTQELAVLAKTQKECLYDNHPLDKSVQRKELEAIFE